MIRDQLITEFSPDSFNEVFQYFNQNIKQWKIPFFKKISSLYELYLEISKECVIISAGIKSFFNTALLIRLGIKAVKLSCPGPYKLHDLVVETPT